MIINVNIFPLTTQLSCSDILQNINKKIISFKSRLLVQVYDFSLDMLYTLSFYNLKRKLTKQGFHDTYISYKGKNRKPSTFFPHYFGSGSDKTNSEALL